MSRVVLTPSFAGADGVSAVSRLVADALTAPPWSAAVTAVSLREAGNRPRFAAAAVRAMWQRGTSDVIACHLHLAPALLARRPGTRAAVVLHGIEAWTPLRARERWALRSADAVLAVSHHTAARFRAANPDLSSLPIAVCHPGIPAAAPADSPAEQSAATDVLIVARMAAAERYKGHDLLLDLWPEIAAAVPPARLLIAGDGDDRARLQARAVQLGLGERVVFLGYVTDDELVRCYRRCGFFAMPSREEGFGLVFLEAMRAGKACVGGAGAAAEIIEHEATGLIVDPRRRAEVRAALVRLLREPDTCARMGRAGAARAARELSESAFRQRFHAALTGNAGRSCAA